MELLLPNKELTSNDLTAFQKSIGHSFPKAFTTLYLKYNGGVPTKEYYNGYNIQVFAPIKHGNYTIEERIKAFTSANPNWKGYVPFGNDSGGNPILMSFNENDYGMIYVLFMGEEELDFIAKSFQTLIEGLTEEIEG